MKSACTTLLCLATAAWALAGKVSDAAIVAWGAPTGIAGDTDVSLHGSLVGAFNMGGSSVSATTINGVLFSPLTLSGFATTAGDFTVASSVSFASSFMGDTLLHPFGSLSAEYRAMLGSFGRNVTAPFTLTMVNLTVGNAYEFQWWVNTSQTVGGLVTATAGNAVTLDSNPAYTADPSHTGGGVGQYAIGSFVADATTQEVIFSGPGTTSVLLNGFQLRDTTPAVPEPTSALTFLGLALLGAAAARRRWIGN